MRLDKQIVCGDSDRCLLFTLGLAGLRVLCRGGGRRAVAERPTDTVRRGHVEDEEGDRADALVADRRAAVGTAGNFKVL